ncbi:MAG: hypothetical protein U9Q05_04365 [Thermodesulfobacteriota bacterium]|nr:hypothetical protein [Thermodesulfobacteriota bacterium]
MGDFATLIIGPTGSGKELVATAIGRSRYIPFNSETLTFEKDFEETFFSINLAEEVISWIQDRLGLEYTWPGNIRELEQCVRNVVIRREYHPAMDKPQEQDEGFIASMREGTLSLEAMCRLYCAQIYNQAGSYAETARRLKIDQRTVKKYVAGSKPH